MQNACVNRATGYLIGRGVLVEVQGGGRLPQQGLERPDLRGAAGAAVVGGAGGVDRCHRLGLIRGDVPGEAHPTTCQRRASFLVYLKASMLLGFS